MSFNYDPKDKVEGGKAEPGKYKFKVDQIAEATFKTGSDGWKATLLVAAFPDRDVKVFENFVNGPNSLWKFEEFCMAFGYDFNNPPKGGWNEQQFEGRFGEAEFVVGDRGYLKVDAFLPAKAGSNDNVPF